jgi:heme/copper-type cytochrome/quinol oxidase subunit 3
MGNKIMIKLFIASEAIFFISLIMGHLFFWRSGQFVQASSQFLHPLKSGIFTLFLIASSGTFVIAEKSFKRGNNRQGSLWLSITVGLGIVFLAGQGNEYYSLLQHQLTIGSSEFGTSFYTLTGFHALHVLLGLILLSILLFLRVQPRRNQDKTMLVVAGIYWHFVDVVWLFVFTIIYLIPVVV